MADLSSGNRRSRGRRGPLVAAIKANLNAVSLQLSLLNHQVGSRLDLRDVDLECLNLIHREGPLNPTTLARRAGKHPATVTGVLDRLEAGGWIARERDPSNRRAVIVRALRDRTPELFALLSGMSSSMDAILKRYDVAELALLEDFLQRTLEAGSTATTELESES